MTTSFYLYALLIAALALALSLGGSRWIEALYGKNREILTFPDDVERRGRWRPYVLGVPFLACGTTFPPLKRGHYGCSAIVPHDSTGKHREAIFCPLNRGKSGGAG